MKPVVYAVVSLVAMWLLSAALPWIREAYSYLHLTVGALATFVFVVSVPVAAWTLATGELTRKECLALAALGVVSFFFLMTNPATEVERTYIVVGVTRDGEATGSRKLRCFEDATEYARSLYKERSDWATDDEGKFVESDVEITSVESKPCYSGLNRLLGTHIGTHVYTMSIRQIDNREDPLSITSETIDHLRYDE